MEVKNLALVCLVALGSCGAGAPAYAQRCVPTDDAYKAMYQSSGAQRITTGLAENGIVEFWGGLESDQWFLILTTPQGVSCLIGAGVGWDTNPPIHGDPA